MQNFFGVLLLMSLWVVMGKKTHAAPPHLVHESFLKEAALCF